ncbi:MAG TPA: RIP metalloprotease RseP [Bryobacteraceae bacterium]|nr:RIP metalloprotease RseP [Bryobacteraceae bacterium]HPU72014.1 RIP metalloprotease RseP [Bryobacteraceae bacterium]
MEAAQNIIWLLVLIGVMILVHELGHYWAARFFNVRIEVFSFGFGPRLFGFRKGETDFRFSAILFGGYVKMAGEQPGDESVDDPRAFLAKPRWQRLIIAFAGPAMNIVLAVGLLTGLFMVKYPKPPDPSQEGMIGYVTPNSPAAKAGIREGDRIVTLDGKHNPTWEDIVIREVASAGRELNVRISRQGNEFWTVVKPVLDERTGVGSAGWHAQGQVEVADVSRNMPAEKAGLKVGDILLKVDGKPLRSIQRLHEMINSAGGRPVVIEYLRQGQEHTVTIQPVKGQDPPGTAPRWMIGVLPQPHMVMTQLAFPDALRESISQNLKSATLIYQFLRGMLEQRLSPKSLEGPIGIAKLSGDAAREGATAFIGLMAVVSLNLAVFNLLPIPILDGGVILMLLVEMLMRRDLSLRVKEAVFKLGFAFLMAVMAFVLYNDITKMLPG